MNEPLADKIGYVMIFVGLVFAIFINTFVACFLIAVGLLLLASEYVVEYLMKPSKEDDPN